MDLLQPDGLPVFLLREIGAPVVVVTLVSFAIFAASWFSFGEGAYARGRNAVDFVGRSRTWNTAVQLRYWSFIPLMIPFMVCFGVAVRLGPRYIGVFPFEGMWEDWGFTRPLTAWGAEEVWYMGVCVATLLLLGFALITKWRFLRIIVAAGWIPVWFVSMLLGWFWALAFVGNVVLGMVTGLTGAVDDFTLPGAVCFLVLAISHLGVFYLGGLIYTMSGKDLLRDRVDRADPAERS
jgi:hypothetical protein